MNRCLKAGNDLWKQMNTILMKHTNSVLRFVPLIDNRYLCLL